MGAQFIMVKMIGSYNIDNEGRIWEDGKCYIMVIFSKFVDNAEIERKIIYFHCKANTFCTVPNFRTEQEITDFLKNKRNYQRV